jgi:NAD(P)-dependent dehydrogenase (short-subunit alcohol dehydrogenase family)
LSSLFALAGKTAVVTGGATGIGWQFAQALAEAGASVAICARNGERCEQAAVDLNAMSGARALGVGANVAVPEDIERVLDLVSAECGRVDILVNNAGTSWAAPAESYPLRGWNKVLDVNLTGTFLFAQAVGRRMIADGGGGKIVNIASAAALGGAAASVMDTIGYNASKGGVIALTLDLAVKWAPHGINVNAIAPGWFPTDMSSELLERTGERLLQGIPLARFGSSEDLKGPLLLLASAAGSFITGQVLVVDGGQTVA